MSSPNVSEAGSQGNDKGNSLRWHVLGGNNKNRVGANSGLCVYHYTGEDGAEHQRALLFDAGVLAGDRRSPEYPALVDSDSVIPDLDSFLYKKDDLGHVPDTPVDSIFLTHNHPDHTGAIPFLLLMGYKLPKIYATPYTAKRLEQELSNAGIGPEEWPEIFAIAPGKAIEEGPVRITAFSVSHSTPQSVGFFIETPEGNILHSGDFKLDPSVVWGPAFSEEQFRRVVSKPVDLLLLDSTGADRDVAPVTEEDVRENLRDLMKEHPNKRFIIAVMGGYEENLASVAMVTAENGRTLWVAGGAHEQTLAALRDTGMSLSDHFETKVDLRVLSAGKAARDLAAARPKQSVVVVTGATGQNNAVLTRAADGHYNALHLDPKTDVIVFCAPSMPGQESTHERLLSALRSKGHTVLTRQDAPLYSHAHARLPEIIEFVKMTNPKQIVPVHGSKGLRNCCATAMEKMGKKVVRSDNGDVVEISQSGVISLDPTTKNQPPLVGFKTLQGTTWDDRYYMMIHVPRESLPVVPTTGGNKKPRAKIFNINGK
ncbi:MAG: ribonuclease J [Proteobacteria bacterium]|nr:ribonuclease J [Pseudomonadota bacterium]